MNRRLRLPDMLDLVEARLDGRPHRALAAVLWVRRLPRRVWRRLRARHEIRERLDAISQTALAAAGVAAALAPCVTALQADLYGTGGSSDEGTAYSDPVAARIQERRRRIEASGLVLIKGDQR